MTTLGGTLVLIGLAGFVCASALGLPVHKAGLPLGERRQPGRFVPYSP